MTTTAVPAAYESYYRNILLRTADLHESLRGKKVFVAGGTGFYGRWFVRFLRYLASQPGMEGLEVQFGSRSVGWDITKPDSYTAYQSTADYLINAAGSSTDESHLAYSDGPLWLDDNKTPTAILLHISTGAIEGDTRYAQAKRYAERHLREDRGRANIRIVRPFATVGPDMPIANSSFAIPSFIRSARAGNVLRAVPGVSRSFCHVADLIVQCLHVMIRGNGEPYDVGSDDAITICDAAKLIAPGRVIDGKASAYTTNSGLDRMVADLTRVRSEFGLSLSWDSRAAILDTLNHNPIQRSTL